MTPAGAGLDLPLVQAGPALYRVVRGHCHLCRSNFGNEFRQPRQSKAQQKRTSSKCVIETPL